MTEEDKINKSKDEANKAGFENPSRKGKKKPHFRRGKHGKIVGIKKQKTGMGGHMKGRKKELLVDVGKEENVVHVFRQKLAAAQKLKDNNMGKLEKATRDPNQTSFIKKALAMKAKIEEEKHKQNQEETTIKPKTVESNIKKVPKEGKKKKKKKLKSFESGEVNQPGYNPPAGIVHEAVAKGSKKRQMDEEENDIREKPMKKKKKTEEEFDKPVEKTRKRFKPSHTKEEDQRTIFIGNLSLDVSEKDLTKMFGEFGEIESVRRRCVPVKNPEQMKRVSCIMKEYHPKRHNSICYIKFKTEEAAKKALQNNGKVVNDLHIRVDIASSQSKDTEKSVFVANLPFDVEEEPLRSHFEDCGSIENVRIVRDRKTSLGKGIGYIKFTEKSSVYLALKLNGSTFQKRSLRVQKCNYNQSNDGKKRKPSDQSTPGPKQKSKFNKMPYDYDSDEDSSDEPTKVKKPKGTSNKQSAFQGEKAKRLKKLKKKSNFKSNMSVFLSANNAPTRKQKSLNKISADTSEGKNNLESSNKHVRFGENEKDKKFKKKVHQKSLDKISIDKSEENSHQVSYKHIKFDDENDKNKKLNKKINQKYSDKISIDKSVENDNQESGKKHDKFDGETGEDKKFKKKIKKGRDFEKSKGPIGNKFKKNKMFMKNKHDKKTHKKFSNKGKTGKKPNETKRKP